MAIRVDHGADTIKFTSTSVMGMSKLASGLPVQYQVSRLLSDGKPRTVAEIATELSDGSPKQVSSDSVDKALKRGEFQQIIDMTTGSTRKVWLNT